MCNGDHDHVAVNQAIDYVKWIALERRRSMAIVDQTVTFRIVCNGVQRSFKSPFETEQPVSLRYMPGNAQTERAAADASSRTASLPAARSTR